MAGVDFLEPGAGQLNKRIQIRLRHDVPMGLSQVFEQHPQVFNRWASLKPVGTAVWAASAQTDEKVTHRCLLRHMDGITDRYEIFHAGRVYRVRRAAPLKGESTFLVLDLEELGDGVQA